MFDIDQCLLSFYFLPDCESPAPTPPPGPGATPAPAPAPPSAEVVAQLALDRVTIQVPGPHTSPDEDGFHLTGLTSWFWMDPDEWQPATARAELGGVWAEVTARPTRAVWTPGDGAGAVTCDGPGRPHPGTAGEHRTDCGHTYTEIGEYTIRVAVTYAVGWRASTGETGTADAIVLTTELTVRVEQRQAVVR